MDKFQESLDFVVKCKYALFKINIMRNCQLTSLVTGNQNLYLYALHFKGTKLPANQ